MMANSFHAFINLENYMGWIELFGLEEAEPIYQKRVLSIVSGAILPLVALGFIKSLVDYIRPDKPEELNKLPEEIQQPLQDEGPYTFETDQEIIPAVGEELPEEDSYSRDADKATTPIVVGEVHIAPEVVNTNNAVADDVVKPITVEHITPVVDPPILTTPDVQISNRPKRDPLVSRPFIRGVESKP